MYKVEFEYKNDVVFVIIYNYESSCTLFNYVKIMVIHFCVDNVSNNFNRSVYLICRHVTISLY